MLAIIIPYYKLTFFEATLESLANQTDKRFKVYVGDDASPENPSNLLEKFKGKFDFNYHKFQSNVGGMSLVKQWERCLAMKGDEEWIMILGDDDVLGVNLVELFYENLNEVKLYSNVVRFSTYKIDEKGKKTSILCIHPKIEDSTDFLFRGTRSSLSEYIFNKKQIHEIGFKDFSLAWFSDVLAVLEFSDFKKVFTINEAQVYIRITDLSISGNQYNLKFKAKATFEFYYYLLTQKSNFFSNIQKAILLKKIEKCYLYNKKEIFFFVKISKIYLFNFFVLDYLRFLKSIFLISLKRTNKK